MLVVGLLVFPVSVLVVFLGVASSGSRIRAAFGPGATARSISEVQRAMVTPPWLSGVILLGYLGLLVGLVLAVIGLIS